MSSHSQQMKNAESKRWWMPAPPFLHDNTVENVIPIYLRRTPFTTRSVFAIPE